MLKTTMTILCMVATLTAKAQHAVTKWNTAGAGNPIVPGYFADPTIRKFGDTYYIYATTDGTGNGYGPAQVWMSQDFVNWRNVLMNWPTTEVVWAPDVVQQEDGSYRYYYCTPCEVRVGESTSPIGPWVNRLGETDAVLVPDRFVHNAITLDPQLFRDDDGSEYLYFGTWGIYKDFGCGVAKLADDGKSFTDKKLILNTEITDFFEAPFVFKRNGIYYFTYSCGSCHDDTYRVQYAVSTEGPMGPYQYKGCILKTNEDGTIHGPGHHSVLVDGDNYYMVYHRHNNPHAIHGFHRQICIDEMKFDANGDILPIVPTHEGVVPASLQRKAVKNQLPNLAFGAKVTASSTYSEWFKPEYAVDDNNGTLWRSAEAGWKAEATPAWLQIDLGQRTAFNQIWTQFEYATFFYQYKIETSDDGNVWQLYADRTQNTQQGSPMIDKKEANARFVRITITGTQKNGHFPAIWNVKIYRATPSCDPSALLPEPQVDEAAIVAGYPWIHTKDVADHAQVAQTEYVDILNASDYAIGDVVDGVPVVPKDGKAAFRFTGTQTMQITCDAVQSLVYNAPYALTAWIFNPEVDDVETIAQLMPSGNDLATIEFRNGRSATEGIVAHNASFENAGAPQAVKAGVWQHWAVTFDGFNERIYCDGQMVSEKNVFLMLRPSKTITIGASSRGTHPFSGYLHRLRLYPYAITPETIARDMAAPTELQLTDVSASLGLHNPDVARSIRFNVEPLTPTLVRASVASDRITWSMVDNTFATGNDSTALAGLTPTPSTSAVLGVQGKRAMMKMSDVFGNELPVISTPVKMRKKDFVSRATDIQAKTTDGMLTLTSAGTYLSADAAQNGPIESAEVIGDFVAQCRVTHLSGQEQHRTPAYNEGGLVLIYALPNGQQSLVQLGVFPNYNCGNMLTIVNGAHRPQYPNNKGWRFDPYLQLERRGTEIHARTSHDGMTWTEMPGSPVSLSQLIPSNSRRASSAPQPDFDNTPLRVGIYQTTYSDNRADVTFDDIQIWQRKKMKQAVK